MHESERRELLDLLKGDDRFTFNRDVGSLGQTFDNTFDLGEDSPITRSATPAPSKSLNDEKGNVLKNLEFLIPKVPEFAGVTDLRAEFSDFGTGPFDPPLRQNPANVTGEPRKIPGAPLGEVPVPGLPDPQLRGAPADPTTAAAGGVNTPQIALLLSSLGQAIGGDSIGGRIAGAAQQFAQQRVTAGLSEKILSGEKITAQDLLGVDPQTALKIRLDQKNEEARVREEKREEQRLGFEERRVTTGEETQEVGAEAQDVRAEESAVRTEAIRQRTTQLATQFETEQGFDASGFFQEIGPQFGLDLGGVDFGQVPITSKQAIDIVQSLSDVQQAQKDRQARANIANIRSGAQGRPSFTQEQFDALKDNPATIPTFRVEKQEIERRLNLPIDDINSIDDPTQLRSMQQRLAEINDLLLRLGEDPSQP